MIDAAKGRHNDRAVKLTRAALLLAFVLALFAAVLPAHADPVFPKLTGRVTDAAAILPADVAAALDARLKTLEDTTSTQLVVATVPDLQGYEIEEYGYQLGRAWGIGQKGKNNGALLIVAPKERRVRIEVGYGLEGVLTDAVTSQIIRRDIVPSFKAGDMAGGVNAGADALIKLLALPPGERDKVVQQAAAAQTGGGGGGGPGAGTIVWLIIILIWVALAVTRRKRGLSAGPGVIWGPGLGGWGDNDRGGGGGWGGGGGGWGGGGGGFGGGGGGFGGGGSSGGW